MRVRRWEERSSNITYDYKNSSTENNFLIKFQNFCRKHFLVTLYNRKLRNVKTYNSNTIAFLLADKNTPSGEWTNYDGWRSAESKNISFKILQVELVYEVYNCCPNLKIEKIQQMLLIESFQAVLFFVSCLFYWRSCSSKIKILCNSQKNAKNIQ